MDKVKNRIKYRLIIPTAIKFFNSIFKERNYKSIKPLEPAPFFIIGSGRNGSTLLSAILNNNPSLFIPPEQYVLPYAIMKWHLYRHMPTSEIVKLIVNDFSEEKNTSNWTLDFSIFKKYINTQDISNWTLPKLIDEIFRFYGKELNNKKFLWGGKSPLNTHFIKLISKTFPKAKFIFIIRDPRDVILSYSKLKGHPVSNLSFGIWRWNDSIKAYDWLIKKRTKKNILLVKYEQLVTEPEDEIKRIVDFLGVKWSSKMLDHRDQVDNMGVSKLTRHNNLKNSINPSSINKWKDNLNEEQLKEIYTKAKNNMERFNYN